MKMSGRLSDLLCGYKLHVGSLLPVSLPFVSMVPHVFSVNERVALCGDWEHGFFSLTAVGAYNVGSIVLSFDKVEISMFCCFVFQPSLFLFLYFLLFFHPFSFIPPCLFFFSDFLVFIGSANESFMASCW